MQVADVVRHRQLAVHPVHIALDLREDVARVHSGLVRVDELELVSQGEPLKFVDCEGNEGAVDFERVSGLCICFREGDLVGALERNRVAYCFQGDALSLGAAL